MSLLPHANDEYDLKRYFLDLIKIFSLAKQNYGFQQIVFPENIGVIKVTSGKSFLEWVYSIDGQSDKNKILSIVKRPFIEEVLAQDLSDLSKYYYVNVESGIPETYCSGLATAHIKKALCLSLSSHALWDETNIKFYKIINDEFEFESVFINNISKEEHFASDRISKFIEYLGDVQLVESNVLPDQKHISLRDDHGKDKLLAFSKRLQQSKYVVSIINSLPFNPTAINLIKKVYSDGKIELVLYWEDKGIGIIIQTTGRNVRETKAIAEILKNEFDK